jgi:hypothetical protein
METESTTTSTTMRPHFRGAIWTLLILAPVIAEVLSGSTRLSILFVLVPEVMTWGCGALLAREFVRRWRAGSVSLLLLGLALSVAEEFVIQQTSLYPLPFPGANASYGRYLGINWVYFLFMLGFESVWVVLIPVEITELLFPPKRDQPWLRTRGLLVTGIVFLLGCRIAWYGWTQQALKRMHVAPYQPPMASIILGLAGIAVLICLAYLLRNSGHANRNTARSAPHPWIAGSVSFLFSAAWWTLMMLVFVPHPRPGAIQAVALGVAWGTLGCSLLNYWSSAHNWSDMHRWSTSFGATVASMLPSYLSLAGWSQPDLIFKIVVNVAAFASLLLLGNRIRRKLEDIRMQVV